MVFAADRPASGLLYVGHGAEGGGGGGPGAIGGAWSAVGDAPLLGGAGIHAEPVHNH